MNKVFGGMAASLDGYIASKDGDMSWLNNSMAKGEDYGFAETIKRTGIYIIGANTYRGMLGSGMAGGKDMTPTYVITHDQDLKKGSQTQLYSGDLTTLAKKAKSETDKDICIFGGGNILTQFIELNLVDEITISIVPVLLGDGTPFFGKMHVFKKLKLSECKEYKSGIVTLTYKPQ
jgi:dihydrofolate reductase